jgi:hypothetical protein
MSFESLWRDVGAWSNATFGDETERGPVGPLKHLAKEVLVELLGFNEHRVNLFMAYEESWAKLNGVTVDPCNLTEHADVQILAMDAARRAGHTAYDLLGAVRDKHAVNVTRTYPRPTGDEISEHVKGAAS